MLYCVVDVCEILSESYHGLISYGVEPYSVQFTQGLRYSGTEVIKLFSCSTQLSMVFQLLIKYKKQKNKDFSGFQILRCCIYHVKC